MKTALHAFVLSFIVVVSILDVACASDVFPVERFSNESIEKYRFGDKEAIDLPSRMRERIKEYNDVRKCLLPTETNKPYPDIRKFDWRNMSDEDVMAICIFRIASSINNIEILSEWFRQQEFAVTTVSPVSKYSPFVLNASQGTRSAVYKSRSSIINSLKYFFAWNYNISVSWKPSGRLSFVIPSYLFK